MQRDEHSTLGELQKVLHQFNYKKKPMEKWRWLSKTNSNQITEKLTNGNRASTPCIPAEVENMVLMQSHN